MHISILGGAADCHLSVGDTLYHCWQQPKGWPHQQHQRQQQSKPSTQFQGNLLAPACVIWSALLHPVSGPAPVNGLADLHSACAVQQSLPHKAFLRTLSQQQLLHPGCPHCCWLLPTVWRCRESNRAPAGQVSCRWLLGGALFRRVCEV